MRILVSPHHWYMRLLTLEPCEVMEEGNAFGKMVLGVPATGAFD